MTRGSCWFAAALRCSDCLTSPVSIIGCASSTTLPRSGPMATRLSERLLRPPATSQRRLLGLALAIAAGGVLTYVDIATGNGDIVIGTVVLAPLVCALLATAR